MNKQAALILSYIEAVGGRQEAAKRIGVSLAMVGHMATGRRGVSPKVAKAIEADTGGVFRKAALRPDLWGTDPAPAAD